MRGNRLIFKSSFIRNYIKPAIEHGLLTLENQDKPNAPNQRYGLTVKGKALYYEHRDSIQNDPQIVQVDPQKALKMTLKKMLLSVQ